ncbi:MAG TPA: hypothetical protein VIT92_01950, partial [Burkholderiaceae bacterium]
LIYAASNQVSLGALQLFSYRLPAWTDALTSAFRASGRFVWPVVYLAVLAILAALLRLASPRHAAIALTAALALQAYDLAKARSFLHARWQQRYESPLHSSFWQQAAKTYRHIAFVLPVNDTPGYLPLAMLAAPNQMSLNGGYQARIDAVALERVHAALRETVRTGAYAADTLYIFNDDTLWLDAHATFKQPGFIGRIDGYNVIAPGYTGCTTQCGMQPHLPGDRFRLVESFDFSTRGNALAVLGTGWSPADDSGRWSDGPRATLKLQLDPAAARVYTVRLTLSTFLAPGLPSQRVLVAVNGAPSASWTITTPGDVQREFDLGAAALAASGGAVALELRFPDARSPREMGANPDPRMVGAYLRTLSITAR